MQVKLFHAPYLAEDGLDHQRLGAVVVGDGESPESLVKVAQELRDFLTSGADPLVLMLPDGDSIGWL